MKKTHRFIAAALALTVVVTFAGCAKTSQVEATGKGTIRGINAIATSPELQFLIEERSIGPVSFKSVAGYTEFDDLTYNFNFDLLIPGDTSATRLATQFIDVIADTEYTVVIAGTIANPSTFLWESPERAWEGTETVFQADFAHLSPALGEVDVYFDAPGTVPVLGNAVASLAYGDRVPYVEMPSGTYELTITPKDTPGTISFQSGSITSATAASVTYAIFDADPSTTASIAVNQLNANGGSATVNDVRIPANFRLLHAAFGTGNVDAYVDNDFSAAVFSNVGFGEISAYSDIVSTTVPFTVTDTGNSGAPVHESDITVAQNFRSTVILGGEAGTPVYRQTNHDARPLETFPVVRFMNMSFNAAAVTIYMLDPGTVIDENTGARFTGMPTLADTGFFGPAAGTYEVTLTLLDDLTPIATPFTITIANGDILDFVILDTADPTMVSLFRFDGPSP